MSKRCQSAVRSSAAEGSSRAQKICFPYAGMAAAAGMGWLVWSSGFVEQGQDGFAEIAFVGDLPLVVGLDEDRAGQPQ
jgi:hypothetical protein